MARTEITINEIPFQGALNPAVDTAGDATNGMQFANEGNTLLHAINNDASAKQVTVDSVDDPFGRQEDIVESVGAGNEMYAGPFIPSIWNQPGGKVFVDLDADTSVVIRAIRFSPRK